MLVRRGALRSRSPGGGQSRCALSERSFCTLVRRAKATASWPKVRLRADVPTRLFRDLSSQATALVRQCLLASAAPAMQAAPTPSGKDLQPTGATKRPSGLRDRATHNRGFARRPACSVRRQSSNSLTRAVCGDGGGGRIALCGADRGGGSTDGGGAGRIQSYSLQIGQLVLGHRGGPLAARPGGQDHRPRLSIAVRADFDRLSPGTAQRVVRFWQMRSGRQTNAGGGRSRGLTVARARRDWSRVRRQRGRPSCGKSDNRVRGLHAWPWPRTASRKSPATLGASRRHAPPSMQSRAIGSNG